MAEKPFEKAPVEKDVSAREIREAKLAANQILDEHRTLFESFGRDHGVHFTVSDEDTSTFDPASGKIGIPWRFFIRRKKKLIRAMTAVSHELGHLNDVLANPVYVRQMFPASPRQEHFDFYNVIDDMYIDHQSKTYPPLHEDVHHIYSEARAYGDWEKMAPSDQYLHGLLHYSLDKHVPESIHPDVAESIENHRMVNGVDVIRLIQRLSDPEQRHAAADKVFLGQYLRFKEMDEEKKKSGGQTERSSGPSCGHAPGSGSQNPFGLSDRDLTRISEFSRNKAQNADPTPEQVAKRMTEASQKVTEYSAANYRRDFLTVKDSVGQMADELGRIAMPTFGVTRRLSPPQNSGPRLDRNRLVQAMETLMTGKQNAVYRRTVKVPQTVRTVPSEINIHIIADMSKSMDGIKSKKQRQAVVLTLEGISEHLARQHKLREKTQQWKAGFDMAVSVHRIGEQHMILKELHEPLSPASKIILHQFLYRANEQGTREDFALRHILGQIGALPQEQRDRILNQQTRHIVMLMTDGLSHNVSGTIGLVRQLRQRGVKVWGIGITKNAQAVLSIFSPDGRVVENPVDLPHTIGSLITHSIGLPMR